MAMLGLEKPLHFLGHSALLVAQLSGSASPDASYLGAGWGLSDSDLIRCKRGSLLILLHVDRNLRCSEEAPIATVLIPCTSSRGPSFLSVIRQGRSYNLWITIRG